MQEHRQIIEDYFTILDTKRITEKEKEAFFADILLLYKDWFKLKGEDVKSVRHCKEKFIPYIEKALKKASTEYLHLFYTQYMSTYAFCGRRDLECFIDYMESERPYRVLDSRRDVLMPFVDALTRLTFDDSMKMVVASYPPSLGKSFTLNYYSAFLIGMSVNNSILRMSYSDELVNGFSRSIKDLISNPLFTNVFTDYALYGGKPFAKDKENEWQVKGADVMTNHYARPRGGQITGVRANKAIILDDMTKGAEEATNSQIHKDLYIKWTTEILNRDDSRNGKVTTKFVLAGTMWSPEDLLNKVREDEERYSDLKPSKKYKYTWETNSAIFIRVPALDENDESTCPSVKSTEYYRQLRDKVDPYFFACVYQQEPIAPTGLEFNYDAINTYEKLPENEQGLPLYTPYCMASLDPARKGKDFVSMPIFTMYGDKYYLLDVVYKQKPMTDLYDLIVEKIIQHKIVKMVLENNIDVSLKQLLTERLKAKGYFACEIIEKFSVGKKEQRIKDSRGLIKQYMMFKSKKMVNRNTDYGRFMEDFTNYSFDFANKHDDAPDSLALFTVDIILGRTVIPYATAVSRSTLGF